METGGQAGVLLKADAFDHAQRYVADAYAQHHLILRDRAPIHFRMRWFPVGSITLGRLTYGASVELEVPPLGSMYHVNIPVSGHTVLTQRGIAATSGAGRGVAINPVDRAAVAWSTGAVHIPIGIPRVPLEEHLSVLLGRPVTGPLRLESGFGLDSAAGQSLLSTVQYVWSELARPGGAPTHLFGARQLECLLMTRLLWGVPHQYSDGLASDEVPIRSSRIQQVIDWIECNPDRDLSTAALAEWAGISARALQLGFRKVTGVSPGTYVRNCRLDRVHRDLARGTAEPITELAFRHGFGHLGRFAQQYRERYGELPSDTTKRNRR